MLSRKGRALLMASMVCAAIACTKKQAPPAPAEIPDHFPTAAPPTTLPVLQKTFPLGTSATFPFEVPAHNATPHLHGIFQSFARKLHGPSDDTANIDFVILDEEQQQDSLNNRPSESVFSAEASHDQAVNVDLPPALDHPAKYYLVFRNPPGSRADKVVEANFRLDF